MNADKKKAKALQAKLDKEEKARQQATTSGDDGEQHLEWIMCEQCKKWRVVPPEMAQVLDDSQAAAWTCSMNTWDAPPPAGTSACDVPQQVMDNEDNDDEEDVAGAAMAWPPERFEVGMPCDAKDEYGTFYKAKIVELGDPNGQDKHNVKVHYNGKLACVKVDACVRPRQHVSGMRPGIVLFFARTKCRLGVQV